jgi:hypothetical protein
MLYHMSKVYVRANSVGINFVNGRGVLRTGGRIYGGWIGLCLWIAFVLPVYVIVGACILGHALVMSIIVIVKHYRGTDTPAPVDGRTAARFEGQARYSNRR